MIKFTDYFSDIKIVSPLATHLSWSHFIELLPIESEKARQYYAQDTITRNLGVRELRRQISRKAYERKEIANTALSEKSKAPFNVFKDPYLVVVLLCKKHNSTPLRSLREKFFARELAHKAAKAATLFTN